MSITVRELADKLAIYCGTSPLAGSTEIMLAYDGDVAFAFGCGVDNQAMGISGVERFLVLIPDLRSKKLMLKERECS